jgi:hypothetical protein
MENIPNLDTSWVRRYNESFIKKRRLQLDEYLDDLLTMNPSLQHNFDMQAFLFYDNERYKKYLNKVNYFKVVCTGISKLYLNSLEPECLSGN